MHLVSFNQPHFAYTFAGYMASKGIVLRVGPDEYNKTALFIDDKQHIDQVTQELKLFLDNPKDEKYKEAGWQNRGQSTAPQFNNKKKFNILKIMTPCPITSCVTIICLLLYGLQWIIGPYAEINYLGFPISSDYYSQIWRFITPVFIHFSVLHILFNLTWWCYLGGMIEKKLGWKKLLEITLLAGLLSNYAEAIIVSPYFGGLSGVAYALMGYAWLYGQKRPNSGLGLESAMMGFAVIWLIAGYTGLLGTIANSAHLSGLVVGLLLAAKDTMLKKSHKQ